jgi:hypothetical protein
MIPVMRKNRAKNAPDARYPRTDATSHTRRANVIAWEFRMEERLK